MRKIFQTGDRVITTLGYGIVISKRMSPPTYDTVQSYCIKLVGRRPLNYISTAFRAEDVSPA
jgi:hypothetical protein